MNGNIENVDPSEWGSIFFKPDNIIRMLFKSYCGFEKRKCKNNEFRPPSNVPSDSFDDVILITEQTKKKPAFYVKLVQTESENIFFERSEI